MVAGMETKTYTRGKEFYTNIQEGEQAVVFSLKENNVGAIWQGEIERVANGFVYIDGREILHSVDSIWFTDDDFNREYGELEVMVTHSILNDSL